MRALILAMVLVGLLGCANAQNNSTMTRADSIRTALQNPQGKEILVIAKQGDWHGTVANSIDAIRKAIDKGAHIALIDLKKDEQGDIVLNTDEGKRPTLQEALEYAKGKILIGISNPQNYYRQIQEAATATGTTDEVVLYDDATGSQFMHIAVVDLDTDDALQSLSDALQTKPVAVELRFKEDDNQRLAEAIAMTKGKSRILFNTSQAGLAGSHTDPSSPHDDTAAIWSGLIKDGGTVLCTNQLKHLMWYLHPETKTAAAAQSSGDEQQRAPRRGGGGIDKSGDTVLTAMIAAVVPQFKTYTFDDKQVGRSMQYNLFLPKDYDGTSQYPMVLFMPDASTVGKGAAYTLTQGYGGIIWATEENQKKNPCIVLVPYFAGPDAAVNDQWETSDEVAIIPHLVEHVVSQYAVDRKRIYTTGQSMGGMISFYLNVTQPDLFAASMFVSSQWDTNVLAPLANKKFFYVLSDGDAKASPKMTELGELLTREGAKYSETQFSARLPLAQQNAEVEKIIRQGNAINFVRFDAGTVMPEDKVSPMAEHMYAFDRAYLLDAAREWLFKQSK